MWILLNLAFFLFNILGLIYIQIEACSYNTLIFTPEWHSIVWVHLNLSILCLHTCRFFFQFVTIKNICLSETWTLWHEFSIVFMQVKPKLNFVRWYQIIFYIVLLINTSTSSLCAFLLIHIHSFALTIFLPGFLFLIVFIELPFSFSLWYILITRSS